MRRLSQEGKPRVCGPCLNLQPALVPRSTGGTREGRGFQKLPLEGLTGWPDPAEENKQHWMLGLAYQGQESLALDKEK